MRLAHRSQSYDSDEPQQFPQRRGICGLCGCGRVPLCIAHVCIPGAVLLQLGALDYELWKDGWRVWTFVFVAFEVPLMLHMLRQWVCRTPGSVEAVKSGSLEWIVYSWIVSVKMCVLYFNVMPVRGEDTTRRVVSLMCVTPVVYCILTFRTLRQFFHVNQDDNILGFSRGHKHRRLHEDPAGVQQVTLDVVLLQDMVWHVAIDMIDMIGMLFYARPADVDTGVGMALMERYPDEIARIANFTGVIIFLGFFFHQQSFPNISYKGLSNNKKAGDHGDYFGHDGGDTVSKSGTGPAEHHGLRSTVAMALNRAGLRHRGSVRSGSVELSPNLTMRPSFSGRRSVLSLGALEEEAPEEIQDPWGAGSRMVASEHGVDVVKARKRSAIISIMLVDLPLFFIRSYIYSLAVSMRLGQSDDQNDFGNVNETDSALGFELSAAAAGELQNAPNPQLDKWWVKNVLCLLLQALQLRFVQQAGSEQSQNLQWRELRAGEQLLTKQMGKKRDRWQQTGQKDKLNEMWAEMEKDQEDYATHVQQMDLAAGFLDPTAEDCEDESENEDAGMDDDDYDASVPSPTNGSDSSGGSGSKSSGIAGDWRHRRRCCGRFCGYRARSASPPCCTRGWRRSCCTCTRHSLMHAMLGFAAGWVISKHDPWAEQTHLLLNQGLSNTDEIVEGRGDFS